MKRVYIPGGPERCQNYREAVVRCGGVVTELPEEAQMLLLTGGGDVEPWRYGAENTASLGIDDEILMILSDTSRTESTNA